MQRQAGFTLLLHAEAGGLHLGEGEAEVLVQVVQLVDEVADVSPQDLVETEAHVTQVRLASAWRRLTFRIRSYP